MVQCAVSTSRPCTEVQRHSRVDTTGLTASEAGSAPREVPGAATGAARSAGADVHDAATAAHAPERATRAARRRMDVKCTTSA